MAPDIVSTFKEPFQPASVVYDRAGHPVDVSGTVWVLNDPVRSRQLDWGLTGLLSPELIFAAKQYISAQIKAHSPAESANNFRAICLLKRSISFRVSDEARSTVPYSAVSELMDLLGHEAWRCHYLRKWYGWCCDQGYGSFSPDVAFQLNQLRIGGNAKGVAVMSADPDEGPLVDLEITALLNALRAARLNSTLDPDQAAALWLCIALGCNPMQFALMREQDFETYEMADGDGGTFGIRVPRHKKGAHAFRSESRLRKLTAEIGQTVVELLAFNRARRAEPPFLPAGVGLPLFSRARPRVKMLDGPMREYALGLSSEEFTALVGAAVERLGAVSPRTGRPLRVTTRRLRYTFATRLVREGASQRMVAELLDHTDLQNVQCYFDLKSDIVESLDKAMALALGPVAQAFLGQLVGSEDKAVRGDRPSSRIYRAKPGATTPVGTCGSFSFCGLYAPIACYTCVRFQPWVEAPHEQVLEDLIADRERRAEQGLDERMVGINDATILAVADVVTRVAAVRNGGNQDVG